MTIEYKGYAITQKRKVIYHKNKISGHEWATHELLKGFTVQGGYLAIREYPTVEKAKEAIDFDLMVIETQGKP